MMSAILEVTQYLWKKSVCLSFFGGFVHRLTGSRTLCDERI